MSQAITAYTNGRYALASLSSRIYGDAHDSTDDAIEHYRFLMSFAAGLHFTLEVSPATAGPSFSFDY